RVAYTAKPITRVQITAAPAARIHHSSTSSRARGPCGSRADCGPSHAATTRRPAIGASHRPGRAAREKRARTRSGPGRRSSRTGSTALACRFARARRRLPRVVFARPEPLEVRRDRADVLVAHALRNVAHHPERVVGALAAPVPLQLQLRVGRVLPGEI